MDMVKIVAVGVIAAVLSLTIKKQAPEIALMISIAAAVLILTMIIPKISAALKILEGISSKIEGNTSLLNTMLKITGIAYIAEFGSQICKDAGEGSIASKIELAGKILIMAASAPVVTALMNMITDAL